jgi:ATP-dependent RNA helicase DDX5/DBP2
VSLQYEREAALRDFSAGTVRVLIATDVASRGLDVKGIGHVINMDLPRAFEDYVHRIGELAGTQCARPAHAVLAWRGSLAAAGLACGLLSTMTVFAFESRRGSEGGACKWAGFAWSFALLFMHCISDQSLQLCVGFCVELHKAETF